MKIKLSRHRFKAKQISHFINNSFVIRTELFTLFYSNNQNQQYAFICPKKTSSSTNRNKIKRQLKEAFLKLSYKIPSNISIVIIANKKIIQSSFKNIHDVLLLSLKKTGIVNENN